MERNYDFYLFSKKELSNDNIALTGIFVFKQNKINSRGFFTKYEEQKCILLMINHYFKTCYHSGQI